MNRVWDWTKVESTWRGPRLVEKNVGETWNCGKGENKGNYNDFLASAV